jgi:hypothetical protein
MELLVGIPTVEEFCKVVMVEPQLILLLNLQAHPQLMVEV